METSFASDLDELLGKPKWRRRLRLKYTVPLALVLFVFWFVPPVWKLVYGPVTVTRWDRKAGETRAVVGPGEKGWIPTKKVSHHALHAIISAEDGKFYEHHGFDVEEIYASIQTNLKKKKFARGGSTISQQVVKMAFLGREKTLLRKAREAAGTALMELILPKDKILEWYVNMAEFGDAVYGIEEGCWHYFKTKPELLSIDQAVHLALVLPSPNSWSRGLRARHLTPFGQRRFASILNRMRQSGYITRAQWATAITRGDFGRPIAGYASLLAADEQKQLLCPGNPGCPETDDSAEPEDQAVEDQNEIEAAPPPVSVSPGSSTAAPGTETPTPGGDAAASNPAAAAANGEPPQSPSPSLAPSPAPSESAPAAVPAGGAPSENAPAATP